MSTTPKKPHKHAAIIKAWADGKEIEYKPTGGNDWHLCTHPQWMKTGEYRIKPEPAAPVYPETSIPRQELENAVDQFIDVFRAGVTLAARAECIRLFANIAIRRAIDDGQVVVPGSVVNAEFTPAQPIKPGETVYHESKVWQAVDKRDLALARSEELMAERDEQADRLVKQLEHAQRVLQANGFTYSPDEGWSIHSGWRGQVMHEKQERITYLEGELTAARRACEQYKAIVHRVGRAVAKHLNRSDITENQIAAIVLLERAK